MQKAQDKAAVFLQTWEGCRLAVYLDVAGIETVGYGHVVRHGDKRTLTRKEALSLLHDDVLDVATKLTWPELCQLNENQKAAIIAITYNIGLRAFNTSHLKLALQAGIFEDVGLQWMRWVHAGGHVVRGLISRRSAELVLFNCKDGLS